MSADNRKFKIALLVATLLGVVAQLHCDTLVKDIYLRTSPTEIVFGNDAIELRFDHASGSLKQVIDRASGTVVLDADRASPSTMLRALSLSKGGGATTEHLSNDPYFQANKEWVPSAPRRAEVGKRGALDLSGDWRFQIDPKSEGLRRGWEKADFDDNAWRKLRVPGFWEEQGVRVTYPNMPRPDWGPYNGDAWYRLRIVIPKDWAGQDLKIYLGAIDDFDWVYFNGTEIGSLHEMVDNWYLRPRVYAIPQSRIKFGEANCIAVRVYDRGGEGGFRDGPVFIAPAALVDKYVQGVGKRPMSALEYVSHETERTGESASLKIHSRSGDWSITTVYILRAGNPIAERQVELRNEGKAEALVQNVCLALAGISIGAPAECSYSIPMNYPPGQTNYGELVPGRSVGCQNGSHSARFIAVHNGRKQLSVVAAAYSEEEHGSGNAVEGKDSIGVQQRLNVIWQAKPGASARLGSQYICVAHGSFEDALKQAQKIYDLIGLHVPSRTAEAAARAVIYSAHPGGTIDSGFRDVGGFKQFAEYLPELQRLGINTLWLLPIWKGPVYAPDDYYKLDERLGTPGDLKSLVDRAHGLGIKVLLDLIPHGPRDVSGLQNEHPDRVSRDEKGELLYWWGCLSCDYAHPGWQKYMGDHAAYWVKTVGVDGYRVDCAAGGPPNYRPFETNRASMSGLYGGMKLLEVARKAMEQVKPDIFILPEAGGPFFFRSGDYVYDWAFGFKVAHAAITEPPEQWCQNAMRWLENEKLESPPGANYMHFLENHDTVRAERLYGVGLHKAMMAVCAFIKGTPFVYHFQEIGYAPYFSRLYHIRAAYDELTLGEAYYQAARCSAPGVFVVLRGLGGKWSCAAVNMSPDPVECPLSLPSDLMKIDANAQYALFDAFSEKRLRNEAGGETFLGRQLDRIPLRLDGYSPAVIVVRKSGGPDTARFTEEKPPSFQPLPALQEPRLTEDDNDLRIENGACTLVIAKDRGGLIRSLCVTGASPEGLIRSTDFAEGRRKIWIGGRPFQMSRQRMISVQSRKTPEGIVVTLAGNITRTGEKDQETVATYQVRYTVERTMKIRVSFQFVPATRIENIRGSLINTFSFQGATHWFVNTVEGFLCDDAVLRNTFGERITGRSWHGVGDRLWGSGPLPLDDLAPGLGAINEKAGEYLLLSDIHSSLEGLPERTYVTDNLNGNRGLHILFGWLDNIRPVTMERGKPVEFAYTIQVGRGTVEDIHNMLRKAALTGPVRMKIFGSRYVVENDHYRAAVVRSRGAELEELVAKGDAEPIVTGSDIYTDYGIYKDYKDPLGRAVKTKATTTSDIEPEVEVSRRPDRVELRFRSYFRHPYGSGRSLLGPRMEYRVSYVFDSSPEILVQCGVRPHFMITDADLRAFLAHTLSLSPMTHWAATGRAGLKQGELGETGGRFWQSREEGLREKSPFALFANDEKKRFIIVRPVLPWPDCANFFLLQGSERRGTIFFAWFDGPPTDKLKHLEPRWYEFSYRLRPGTGTFKDALTFAQK